MKLVGGQGILVEVTSVWLADPPTFVFQLSQYANVFLSLGHAFWFLSWYRGLLSLCVGHSLAKAQAGSQFVAGCRPSRAVPGRFQAWSGPAQGFYLPLAVSHDESCGFCPDASETPRLSNTASRADSC